MVRARQRDPADARVRGGTRRREARDLGMGGVGDTITHDQGGAAQRRLLCRERESVLIGGVPAADIRDDERRRLFGCVEQTFHMVPGTVRDQITLYDSTISDEAVHTAAELTGLKDTIESMEKGYDTRCTDDLFSQGQWQLLSIARAAAAAPSMLLFDEITANLDAETERAVLSALKRVAENRTVISISHRTSAELGRIIALTD